MEDKDMEYEYNAPEGEDEDIAKKKKYTKGFYVVFALCLCAIGAAGWYTYSDVADYMNDTEIPESITTSTEPENKQAEAKVEGVDKKDTTKIEVEATEEITEPLTDPETEPPTEQPTELKRVMPAEKTEVITEFSGDKLVYFETLKDWRVHKGADYSVKKGENIYAVDSGTITDFFKDNLYGNGIKLELAEGFTAIYYGVKSNESIAVGSVVNAGDLIGIAESVPCEKDKKDHIHLEIQKDGNYVNPQNYLNKNA